MASMDYCKFENTHHDMKRCINALENRNISSNTEKEYASDLLRKVCTFLQDEGIIDEYYFDKIDEILRECKERN